MALKPEMDDVLGRFRDIIADPLNDLIDRVPAAGTVVEDWVTLHNGHQTPRSGSASYYDHYTEIIVLNRGVMEPLEEFTFQTLLQRLPADPNMLELGCYWGHYSMWLKQRRPQARLTLVDNEIEHLDSGLVHFARHGYQGEFHLRTVSADDFCVDDWLGQDRLTILHADIQGGENMMLEHAIQSLAKRQIDYLFLATHSQSGHDNIMTGLQFLDYRVEVNSPFEDATAWDGFILATSPWVAPVLTKPWTPWGIEATRQATPQARIAYLYETMDSFGLLASL